MRWTSTWNQHGRAGNRPFTAVNGLLKTLILQVLMAASTQWWSGCGTVDSLPCQTPQGYFEGKNSNNENACKVCHLTHNDTIWIGCGHKNKINCKQDCNDWVHRWRVNLYLKTEEKLNAVPFTVWKVSKYGVSSGPYLPTFGMNTRKYGPKKAPYLDTFQAVIFCPQHGQSKRNLQRKNIKTLTWNYNPYRDNM